MSGGDEGSVEEWDAEQRRLDEEREQLDNESHRRCVGETPEQVLISVARRLREMRDEHWVEGRIGGRFDYVDAKVYRTTDPYALLVTGASSLATALRELLAAGAAAEWRLFPAERRTPLQELENVLRSLNGTRYVHALRRGGFDFVEEVAALPEKGLLDFRGAGAKFIPTLREALAALNPDSVRVPDGDGGRPSPRKDPVEVRDWLVDEVFESSFATVARWAVLERGAARLGDVLVLADGMAGMPEEVLAAWERAAGRELAAMGGATAGALDDLALELLRTAGRNAQTVMLARSFAEVPASREDLSVQLGINPDRVDLVERRGLELLAGRVRETRFAPLRWRAGSRPQDGEMTGLTRKVLGWIARLDG